MPDAERALNKNVNAKFMLNNGIERDSLRRYDVCMTSLHSLSWRLAPLGVQRERARLIATAEWCVAMEFQSGFDELRGALSVELALSDCLCIWLRLTVPLYRGALAKHLAQKIDRINAQADASANMVSSIGSLKNRFLAGADPELNVLGQDN